jgi:hypothetical protein
LTIARCTALCLLALAALVAVPAAPAAKLVAGERYSGQTSDGDPVQLRLSGNLQRVARMRIHYTLQCSNGNRESSYTDILNAPVRGGKKFTLKGSYTGTDDQSLNTFRVSGKLTRSHANGTFSLTYTGAKAAGGESVSCKTGRLRWHATRSG